MRQTRGVGIAAVAAFAAFAAIAAIAAVAAVAAFAAFAAIAAIAAVAAFAAFAAFAAIAAIAAVASVAAKNKILEFKFRSSKTFTKRCSPQSLPVNWRWPHGTHAALRIAVADGSSP
jgi:hypothetical protein